MNHLANLQILKDFELPSDLFSLGVLSSQDQQQVFPLARVAIQSQILENLADIELIQDFHNPYEHVIEAVYIFPMPGSAAVYDFEIHVAERLIKGQIQERAVARQAYQEALTAGHRAALLEQERDSVFTLQLGNIAPKESIQIKVKLCQLLDYRDQGLYELRLPTVIAPRYMPGEPINHSVTSAYGVESDTDLVPDASRLSPPRLAPGAESTVAFDLKIELLMAQGQSLSQLQSSQHLIESAFTAPNADAMGKIQLELSQAKERLNRDFVLRWRMHTDAENSLDSRVIQARLYYSESQLSVDLNPTASQSLQTDVGLLQLCAPPSLTQLSSARDVIFLVDRSGSMGEFNMASATRACTLLLDSLSPQDRFAILAFDDQLEWLKVISDKQAIHLSEPTSESIWLNANEDGRETGRRFLNKLQSRGGTELFRAIESSLQHIKSRASHGDHLPILVILTDGQVGDESRILKSIQKQLADALVYTIGIDVAVNDSFLGRLARLGGGTSLCVSPGEKLEQALQSIASEIGFPALRALQLNVPELTPDPIPDLYQGRSLSLLFQAGSSEPLSLQAMQQAEQTQWQLTLQPYKTDFPCLRQLWAKSRIRDLEDQYRLADPEKQSILKQEMIALSTRFQILCRFTAWIAIDQSERVSDTGQRIQIVQAVEDPQELNFSQFTGALPPPPPICPSPMMMAPAGAVRSMAAPAPQKKSLPAQILSHLQEFWQDDHSDTEPLQRTPNAFEPLLLNAINDFTSHFEVLIQCLGLSDSLQRQDLESLLAALIQARLSLIDALAESERAEDLPILQGLLRKESLRLIKALEHLLASQKPLTAADLQFLLHLCQAPFQQFKDEWMNLQTRHKQGVWEQTI